MRHRQSVKSGLPSAVMMSGDNGSSDILGKGVPLNEIILTPQKRH